MTSSNNPTILNDALSKEQAQVFDEILHFICTYPQQRNPIFVVSGYAGTGKTHLFGFVYEMLEKIGYSPVPMTFTGKASSVINQRFGPISRTIHSRLFTPVVGKEGEILGFDPLSERESELQVFYESNPLPVFMVDEASMVPESLLIEMMKYNAPVIFFGDSEQLPPIQGNGESIMDFPDAMLRTIHRQAEKSPIIRLSKHIRETGNFGINKFKNEINFVKKHDIDLNFIRNSNPEMMVCGTNRRKDRLNNLYRLAMGFDKPYPVEGDRIMLLKNSSSFKNGDIAEVKWSKDHFADGRIVIGYQRYGEVDANFVGTIVCYDDVWQSVNIKKDYNIIDYESDTKRIEPACFAYAATCHKVQGSEYANGIFYDEDVSYFLDQRRFRYTAVTRFKNDLTIAI